MKNPYADIIRGREKNDKPNINEYQLSEVEGGFDNNPPNFCTSSENSNRVKVENKSSGSDFCSSSSYDNQNAESSENGGIPMRVGKFE